MRTWLLAFRPKTLTAALVPIIVGTALAVTLHGEWSWWISVFALLSAICIQIGTNLANDAIDHRKGADREDRLGPVRVTQSGLLKPNTVMAGALVFFGLAVVFGAPLVMKGSWPIVLVGLISIVCGYCYTGGPLPLAYHGLGDAFVIFFFGIVAVCGVFYLHTGALNFATFVASLQIGFLATVLIAINNLRDVEGDKRAAKRTMAVRFGLQFARREIAFLIFAPFVLGLYWMVTLHLYAGFLPLVTFPLALRLTKGIFKTAPSAAYNKYLAMAAGLHLSFGILLAIGLFFR